MTSFWWPGANKFLFSPLLFHHFKPETWSMFIGKPVWSLLWKGDADSVAAYKLFVCCFAQNLNKLATEAEKAQPVLSNIIGAMWLYMCLTEHHQMAFDVVLSQGHNVLHTADSQLNYFYILYLYTRIHACVYNPLWWFAWICKIFLHLPYLIFSFFINKPLWKNHSQNSILELNSLNASNYDIQQSRICFLK